ncbi:MAG: BlaI/MecI/CopY family transcriptional regulator [Phycisphaeraceae bacterium]|nr:BlaI/MecI/CopY family transcriptional regulator [Phycisphaeraceae bacterium]
MPRKAASQPTEVELQILNTIWKIGPSPIRNIHEALECERDVAFTTTQKMVQVMTEKGLLIKDDSVRPMVFSPATSRDQTQIGLVDDLIQRAFGGAADKLVMQALRSRGVSEKELKKINKMLCRIEGAD